MNLTFTKHAQGRMLRDSITPAEIAQALEHPTHPARPARVGRTLARRVHAHSVVSVLYVDRSQDVLVVSCWKDRR
jgi:hypothetical protein